MCNTSRRKAISLTLSCVLKAGLAIAILTAMPFAQGRAAFSLGSADAEVGQYYEAMLNAALCMPC